jgi:hypothetical protein
MLHPREEHAVAETAAPRIVLDPTSERAPAARQRLPRLATLAGVTVGLLDISKPRGDLFLNRIEERLGQAGARVRRYKKPTFTKPAPVDLRHQIASECGAVIEALAD